jgi:hypothetical protein
MKLIVPLTGTGRIGLANSSELFNHLHKTRMKETLNLGNLKIISLLSHTVRFFRTGLVLFTMTVLPPINSGQSIRDLRNYFG